MKSGVEVRELLGAYACGDLTPEERIAVERFLAASGDAETEMRELKALLTLLAQGARPVTAALLAELRQRVERAASAASTPETSAYLLSASLTGDMGADELKRLDSYLASHPEAHRELKALGEFSRFLTQGQRPVGDELAHRLAERLTAAGAPVCARPAAERPSRRAAAAISVYAAPHKAWRARLAWCGAAVAALVALAVVAAHLLAPKPGSMAKEQLPPRIEGEAPVANDNRPGAEGQRAVGNNQQPRQDDIAAPRNTQPKDVLPRPENAPEVAKQPGNQPRVPEQKTDGAVAHGQDARATKGQPPEKSPAPSPPKTEPFQAVTQPVKTPRSPGADPGPQPVEAPPVANGQQPRSSPGTGGTSGGVTVGPNAGATTQAAAQNTTTVDNTPTPAPANMAVVLTTKDGNVQARMPGGELTVLSPERELPSGTVITSEGRAGLRLPGEGRLWINSGTSLTLTMIGSQETVVTLNRGEISYEPPASGSLTVNAGNAQVSKAKKVDVKVENAALTAYVLDRTALVGPKGKQLPIGSGRKATVALAGTDMPHSEATTGIAPDVWSYDLKVIRTPASSTPDGRSKIRSKR